MLRRRHLVVALVVVALTSLALSVTSHVTTDHPRKRAAAAEAALTVPGSGLEAVTRLQAQNGREWVTSQRLLKQRLVLLATAAAILSSLALARRRGVVRTRARLPLVAWSANHGSRSPPHFQLLTP